MKKFFGQKFSFKMFVQTVLAFIMTAFIVLPLINMFFCMDSESIQNVIFNKNFCEILWNSMLASLITTVISLLLAFLLALCIERSAIPCKGIFRILAVLPMLIPSISIGMGVILLFGNNGFITGLLHLPLGNIYGMNGIILGSVLYSFPVAFLMMDNLLKFEDSSPYEAAAVLGLNRWHQFRKITFPYLKKPIVVIAFSIFSLSFTDYGVPLMVGGKCKTLPVVMYQEVIGQLDFSKGCVYGVILLFPAVIAFIIDLLNRQKNDTVYVIKPFLPKKTIWDIPALIFSCGIVLFGSSPIIVFLILAFVHKYPTDMGFTLDNIVNMMQLGGGKYLINSLIIALCVSFIGVILAILVAYITTHVNSKIGKYLHLLSMSMAAIPGIVLGLAFVLFFQNSALYGTLVILVIVNVAHFFASPYVMIYTAFSKVNRNLEAVASTLGIGHSRFLIDILLPKCKWTVFEMFTSFFVNSMMTISAVSFLANSRTRPIALMINQFEAQAQMEYAAVVSLAILSLNLLVKVSFELLRRKENNF